MFCIASFSEVVRLHEFCLVVSENVPVSPRTFIVEVTVVSYWLLDTSSIYAVSAEVNIPVVQFPPVVLLIKSIHLETLTKVGPVSPRIRIGSD